MLRRAAHEGGRAALAAFGLSQPSLGSVGIKAPNAPGLPSIKPPSVPKTPAAPSGGSGSDSLGTSAAKMAFAVGMGASTSSDGVGAACDEPADTDRRRRSAIDRAFQQNENDGATSSMPLPGNVSP